MTSISRIEGIGSEYSARLRAAGIGSTETLLQKGASRQGRAALSERAGVSEHQMLEWVNRADLFRVRGVAEEYSDLLEAAGVDTVVELAQRNPESLHAKLAEANQAKWLVRRLPTAAQVADWIQQAKDLPKVLTY
jgi:predicted flap endonuclease-1-like 5' DNA nuclease